MKKKERIKQLESELEICNLIINDLKSYTMTNPDYDSILRTKFESYNMAIDLLKANPQVGVMDFLKVVDAIYEWYNREEPIPQPENKLEDWDCLLGKLAWKFTPSGTGEMSVDAFQVFSELQHEFLITRK